MNDGVAVKAHDSTKGVKEKIETAFKRSAEVDSRRLCVEARDGKVSLKGSVRSWSACDETLQAA